MMSWNLRFAKEKHKCINCGNAVENEEHSYVEPDGTVWPYCSKECRENEAEPDYDAEWNSHYDGLF